MKRILFLIIFFVSTLVSLGQQEFGTCGKWITWIYDRNAKELTISGSGEIYMPTLQYPWDHYRAEVQSIIIEEGVTIIGNYAFHDFIKLQYVRIGEDVIKVGSYAFRGCKELSSLIIGSKVKEIGSNAFSGCKKLESVEVPNSASILYAFELRTAIHRISENKQMNPGELKASDLPNLEIVSNSISFNDIEGKNVVQGGKKSKICLDIQNTGKGDARHCKVIITAKGATRDIVINNKDVELIKAGATQTIELPITAGIGTIDGEVEFSVQVNEPNGFGTDPQLITVKTKAFEAPLVKITDYSLTAETGTTLKKKQPFDLQLLLQNIKHGSANDVVVSIELPQNVLILDGNLTTTYTVLEGGETKSLVYSLIVNNNYTSNTIPIKVHLKESLGKYAEDRTISLNLDQAMASTKIAIDARPEPLKEVLIAQFGSDVDRDIPVANIKQDKTFAVVIANENYKTEDNVPYALNDGSMFESYCLNTLGIPRNNVHYITEATLNSIKYQIDWLRQVMDAYNGEARIIFYYAGHGIPNESDHSAYLLPVDGYGNNTSTGYSLNLLYKELSAHPSKAVAVFLDACFSGTKRDGSMMASARGIRIKVADTSLTGNMVVFSAAQGDETAYPFKEQQHGLFTYYLLKTLKETKGNVTLGELSNSVIQYVKRQSIVVNGKMQTPTVIVSDTLKEEWKSLKLIQ